MNPYKAPPISLPSYWAVLWRNRSLILKLTKREIIGRYKGTFIGLVWSFINPLLLLALYTLVFSGIFNANNGKVHGIGHVDYAFFLFVGLILHGLLVEVLAQSPTLIVRNANFVTKIPFPIEILPVIQLLAACSHAMTSLLILLVILGLSSGGLHWQIMILPLLFLPYILCVLGMALILCSLGVYLRDLGHVIGFILTVFLFASPIFYPMSSVPLDWQPILYLNPLTFVIEQSRNVIFSNSGVDFLGLLVYSIACVTMCWGGYICFQKTKRGFANVL